MKEDKIYYKYETAIARDIRLAGNQAMYDANVKRLLSNKELLAFILSGTVRELKGFGTKEIIAMIHGEPEVGSVPVGEGLTNAPRICGVQTEDSVPYEGVVTYDVKFSLSIPVDENIEDREMHPIRILINVEAQKDFYPGYDLVTRGIYYAARQISSQKDREFTASEYDKIKKVYSIWICMDAPQYAANTLTSFRILPKKVVGNLPVDRFRYDLMEVIMIGLSKKQRAEKGKEELKLHRMLEILLSDHMEAEEKQRILETEFEIPMTKKMEKELIEMCNLSELVFSDAMERGLSEGLAKGMKEGMKEGMKKGMELKAFEIAKQLLDVLDAQTIAAKTGLTVEQVEDLL